MGHLRSIPEHPTGQRPHRRQLAFHPSTRIVCGIGYLPASMAERNGLMPCTAWGKTWWYGYTMIEENDGKPLGYGWLLLPRDPKEELADG